MGDRIIDFRVSGGSPVTRSWLTKVKIKCLLFHTGSSTNALKISHEKNVSEKNTPSEKISTHFENPSGLSLHLSVCNVDKIEILTNTEGVCLVSPLE